MFCTLAIVLMTLCDHQGSDVAESLRECDKYMSEKKHEKALFILQDLWKKLDDIKAAPFEGLAIRKAICEYELDKHSDLNRTLTVFYERTAKEGTINSSILMKMVWITANHFNESGRLYEALSVCEYMLGKNKIDDDVHIHQAAIIAIENYILLGKSIRASEIADKIKANVDEKELNFYRKYARLYYLSWFGKDIEYQVIMNDIKNNINDISIKPLLVKINIVHHGHQVIYGDDNARNRSLNALLDLRKSIDHKNLIMCLMLRRELIRYYRKYNMDKHASEIIEECKLIPRAVGIFEGDYIESALSTTADNSAMKLSDDHVKPNPKIRSVTKITEVKDILSLLRQVDK